MARSARVSGFKIAFLITATIMSCSAFGAASSGQLQGVVQNEAGRPLANILVTILAKSSEQSIPILARTNELGRLSVKNIEAGDYEIKVKSADYRTAGASGVEIVSGHTSVIKLILQEFLNPEGDAAENVSVKSLLRTPTARRMIFRDNPDPLGQDSVESSSPLFDGAVFQVYTNAGLGDGYMIFPGNSFTGTSTNFAVVDSFLGSSKYIFAGQLNSGEDSLWRLKNVYQYDLGEHQQVEVYLGYGRISFQEPSLSLLGNPIAIGDQVDYVRAAGTTKMFNVGFQDRLRLGDTLAVVWGVDVNQVRNGRVNSFVNPNLSVDYNPTPGTTVSVLASSKRSTQANAVLLPDGQVVNLDDSMHYARVGEHLTFGASRYYQASLTQKIGRNSEIEFADFVTRRFAGTYPFLAVMHFEPAYEVLQVDDAQAGTRGYRLSWRQNVTPGLRTSFSYVRANALGLPRQPLAGLMFDEAGMKALLTRHDYQSFVAQVEAVIPRSQTTVTTLVKLVPDGRPILTLDPYSDDYETGNQGVNFFVRQMIPMPACLLNFVGLDFLTAPRLEALLDLRNVINDNLGVLHTAQGDVLLVRAPRSVRGGIAFRF